MLHKYSKRKAVTSRKNKCPEKRLVETELLPRALQHGFDLSIVESKAVYSKSIGRYIRGQTSESMTDLVGNNGPIACYIEAKAKGKLSSFNASKNYRQIAFVERKIESGAFVAVVDCFDVLIELWYKWLSEDNPLEKKRILKDALPRRRKKFDGLDFED